MELDSDMLLIQNEQGYCNNFHEKNSEFARLQFGREKGFVANRVQSNFNVFGQNYSTHLISVNAFEFNNHQTTLAKYCPRNLYPELD